MLEGKAIAIIGGTSGIGRALALGLAREGGVVFPASRTLDKAQATAAQIEREGGKAFAHSVEVRDTASIQAYCNFVQSQAGRVDVLINCAGIIMRKPALEQTREDWLSVLEVNLTGTFLACQIFGRVMIEQAKGRIINIGSMGSFVAMKNVAPYCASKGGVLMLTKALAREWAEFGVTVNALIPGFFVTELNREAIALGTERRARIDAGTPMGRVGAPEELVGAAAYLASDSASYVTGTTITVDGGFLATGL